MLSFGDKFIVKAVLPQVPKIALSLMLTQTLTLTQTLILTLIPTLALPLTQTLTQAEEKHYFACRGKKATSFKIYMS